MANSSNGGWGGCSVDLEVLWMVSLGGGVCSYWLETVREHLILNPALVLEFHACSSSIGHRSPFACSTDQALAQKWDANKCLPATNNSQPCDEWNEWKGVVQGGEGEVKNDSRVWTQDSKLQECCDHDISPSCLSSTMKSSWSQDSLTIHKEPPTILDTC